MGLLYSSLGQSQNSVQGCPGQTSGCPVKERGNVSECKESVRPNRWLVSPWQLCTETGNRQRPPRDAHWISRSSISRQIKISPFSRDTKIYTVLISFFCPSGPTSKNKILRTAEDCYVLTLIFLHSVKPAGTETTERRRKDRIKYQGLKFPALCLSLFALQHYLLINPRHATHKNVFIYTNNISGLWYPSSRVRTRVSE